MEQRWPIDIPGIEPVRLLGSGGFGQVWLARQPALDRQVAVKIGHRAFASNDDRRRFERECLALGRLSGHPHIIDVHTSGVIDGLPYLVLEYVDGGTLADERAPWTEAQLRQLTAELADAVGAAHAIGVLHRDLKPENVFLRSTGATVLGDFGIARVGDSNVTSAPGVTASMAFAPPEILNGRPPSEQADIYGIGITIVSAVLGQSPFVTAETSSLEAVVAAVLRGAQPDLEAHGLSDSFSALLRRMIATDPAQRPPSAEALRAELAALDPADAAGLSGAVAAGQPAGAAGPPDSAATAGPPGSAAAGPQVVYRAPTADGPATSLPFPANQPPAEVAAFTASAGRPTGRTALLLATAAVVMLALGIGGAWFLSRDDGTRTVPDEDELSSATDDQPDPDADDTTSNAPDTDAGNTASDTASENDGADDAGLQTDPASGSATDTDALTTDAPTPLAIPVLGATISDLADIPIDTEGLIPLLGPANSPQFCDNQPDITGLVDTTAALYPSESLIQLDDTFIFLQVAQRMHRFSTEDEADAFVDSYVGLVDCESWEDSSLTSEGTSVLRATVVDDGVQYGDKTRRVDQVVSLPVGADLYSRTVLIRSGVDVYKLFVSLDRADDLEPTTEVITAEAVAILGY